MLVTLLGETTRGLARGELHARTRLFAQKSTKHDDDARRRRQHPPDDALICADRAYSTPPPSFSLAVSHCDTSHHGLSDFALDLMTVKDCMLFSAFVLTDRQHM